MTGRRKGSSFTALVRVFDPSKFNLLFRLIPPLRSTDSPLNRAHGYHTAGRDRTGVVAGLLQALAGTAPEDIIFDYMLSRLGTEPARDKLVHFALASVGTTDMETPGFANLVSLRPSYWLAFMEGLEETFGGWDGYVTQRLGFSEKELAKIKTTLRS